MEVWTRSQVLATAPDDASRRAALPLVSSRVWSESGRAPRPGDEPADELLWGRCHGSATYAVVVAPGPPPALTASCTCPSRKSPCKHALALLLRWADALLPPAAPPPWAGVPAAPAGRGADPERVPDPEAAAARAAERRAKVDAGLDELDRWLADQVRGGLSAWERRPWARVEGVAARMVDAQAPGVAGVLRGLPGLLARTDQSGWPAQLLEALAGLHLLVVAHRGLDRLPPDLAATVRSRIGYPVAKAAVLAGPGVLDDWSALGAVDSLEGRLESRRVWLWGRATQSWALLLSFAVPGAGLDTSVEVGQVLHAAVHRYPGGAEHRVLLGEQQETEAVPDWPHETVADARRRWAGQLRADPWSTRMPVVLRAVPVRPDHVGGAWHLADPDGTGVRLLTGPGEPWPLLAASGGDAVDVFGEWGPAGFAPLRLLDATAGTPRLVAAA
ncbi:SWIM zinc finger family protein [Microlunatus flavus]|uniref:SWIM zinc finger family protein n=1 Tax=Microlunatus flavus TaxID=1036181 RepID=UPI00147D9B4E|nr:SWIM zinc finger family protein [Microlunatus flavus]